MSYSHKDSKGVPLDSKLNILFDNKRDGFYIELGAYDGLIQSNTAFFEKNLGWRGILIEPSFHGFKECIINRPNSICLNYACVSNDYKYDYVEGDFRYKNLMGSVGGKRLKSKDLVRVKASTLERLLDEHCHSNIDFLSLDAEGYELEILKGLNLNKYRPNKMLIEVYTKDYDEIINLLNNHNYKLHSNFTNYNKIDNPGWDGTHNDYLFVDNTQICK